MTLTREADEQAMLEAVNQLGAEGWQLLPVSDIDVFWFEREIMGPPTNVSSKQGE